MQRNKKGSTTILLAMVFVFMMTAIVGAITISRRLVVKSESEVFGEIWAMAILSEYDTNLLKDYKLMAYQGNDEEVDDRINYYISYSIKGKLDASIKGARSDLTGYEMRYPKNFKKAINHSFASSAADSLIKNNRRMKREGTEISEDNNRTIKNRVVLDTLPSQGMNNVVDLKTIEKSLENGKFLKMLKDTSSSSFFEMVFIRKYFGNHLYRGTIDDSFFKNEWEYIIAGKTDDKANLNSCKRRIFLIRNALNLAYLYKDPEKVELVVAASEIITPGPGAVVTQAIIMEAWSAAESQEDINTLMDDGRVPVIKTRETWKTDIDSVLGSDEVSKELDDESRKRLKQNKNKIDKSIDDNEEESVHIDNPLDGQTYEEYLQFLMLGINDNVRLLRIMDIVQINMKYRHYEDFNFDEYYSGVRFVIKANGKDYEVEKEYK